MHKRAEDGGDWDVQKNINNSLHEFHLKYAAPMFDLTACNLFMNCCNVIHLERYGKAFLDCQLLIAYFICL
jgi:hypothetical protein